MVVVPEFTGFPTWLLSLNILFLLSLVVATLLYSLDAVDQERWATRTPPPWKRGVAGILVAMFLPAFFGSVYSVQQEQKHYTQVAAHFLDHYDATILYDQRNGFEAYPVAGVGKILQQPGITSVQVQAGETVYTDAQIVVETNEKTQAQLQVNPQSAISTHTPEATTSPYIDFHDRHTVR